MKTPKMSIRQVVLCDTFYISVLKYKQFIIIMYFTLELGAD